MLELKEPAVLSVCARRENALAERELKNRSGMGDDEVRTTQLAI